MAWNERQRSPISGESAILPRDKRRASNEARMDRKQERESLERLLAEAENAVAYIEDEVDFGSSRIDSQRALLETMFADGPVPDDTAAAELGFTTLNFFPAMAPARTTYDEMTATGGLQLIRSRQVRDVISQYYAGFDICMVMWYSEYPTYRLRFTRTVPSTPSILIM